MVTPGYLRGEGGTHEMGIRRGHKVTVKVAAQAGCSLKPTTTVHCHQWHKLMRLCGTPGTHAQQVDADGIHACCCLVVCILQSSVGAQWFAQLHVPTSLQPTDGLLVLQLLLLCRVWAEQVWAELGQWVSHQQHHGDAPSS
jgi:hypothetical protein